MPTLPYSNRRKLVSKTVRVEVLGRLLEDTINARQHEASEKPQQEQSSATGGHEIGILSADFADLTGSSRRIALGDGTTSP
jgi:hypothetical protein